MKLSCTCWKVIQQGMVLLLTIFEVEQGTSFWGLDLSSKFNLHLALGVRPDFTPH